MFTRTPFVFSFLLVVASTTAFGITYSNERLTTAAPAQSGCVIPPAVNSFVTSDNTAYLYFEANVTTDDSITYDWVAPDGAVLLGGSWNPISGNYCFTGAGLPITDLSDNRLGSWRVRVWNNKTSLVFSIGFVVNAPPTNLITNGGFETGLTGWNNPDWGNSPTPSLSNVNPHGGANAACLGTPLDSVEPQGNSGIYQWVDVPNDGYTLSFWYRPWTSDNSIQFGGQYVAIYDSQGNYLTTLMGVLEGDNTWKKQILSLAPYSGQRIGILFDVYEDGAGDPTGMCVDDVSVTKTYRASVFLVHGIAQQSSDLNEFANNLSSLLDPDLYTVDSHFDYSECANTALYLSNFCPATCTIENGARKLAAYIQSSNAGKDIVLIGYSLGGLIARDLILNNYSHVLDNRRVSALVTLGTPNLGYPYEAYDDNVRCSTLVREMFGDLRNTAKQSAVCNSITTERIACSDFSDRFGNTIALSPYLYDLNTRWSSLSAQQLPGTWMAGSGTFCQTAVRDGSGCTDNTPANDGVVCDQSARYLWSSAGNNSTNGPQDRSFANASYAHTISPFTWAIFCNSNHDYLTPLYDPGSDLIGKIKVFLDGRQ